MLEGSRFAKDLIPFLSGVRLAAAQQMLVGVILVAMIIHRPEGLLPEQAESGARAEGPAPGRPAGAA